MSAILDRITTKQYLMFINICVLAVHISLIFLFKRLYTWPMVYLNIGSVICYCICFFLVAKARPREYVLVIFTEVLIHTSLAVYYVGDNAGFQLYYLGCIAIMLFTHYFSVHSGIKPHNGPVLSAICCVLYVLTMIFSRSHTPLYPLSFDEQFYLRVYNVLLMFLFILASFSLLTLVASRNEMELTRQASHDNLTGLVNRNYLTKNLIATYETEDRKNQWLAILDIDDFKMINDQYGHLCGDYVLCAVANIMTALCGDLIVCRWGGEEFLIVGDAPQEEGGMLPLLERIRSAVAAKEFVYNGDTKMHLTVTIGAAPYQPGQALRSWVNLADSRLYAGKQSGKNKVVSGDA